MTTVTMRFRGICCFIDPTNGATFEKRVVLPNGGNHRHSIIESHLAAIEFFAEDLDAAKTSPDLKPIPYTRPGDDAKYARIEIDPNDPMIIEVLNAPYGQIKPGPNLVADSMIHLDTLLRPQTFPLRQSLLGAAKQVDATLVTAMIDLPAGTLMAGPPEPTVTSFEAPVKFDARRVARWFDHIFDVGGAFGLRLTPLSGKAPKEIIFKPGTQLVTIAHEPERLFIGRFVKHPLLAGKATDHSGAHAGGGAAKPQPTGHFDMYWDLIADPPASRPVPAPAQGGGVGCNPSGKP